MAIIGVKLFFETDIDEDGCSEGVFYGENIFVGPVYSQEMALRVLKSIAQFLDLSKEEKTGVEVCIENSGLPPCSSEEEKLKIRINNLEAQMEDLYEIIEENANYLDKELDKNLKGGDGEAPSGHSIH